MAKCNECGFELYEPTEENPHLVGHDDDCPVGKDLMWEIFSNKEAGVTPFSMPNDEEEDDN